MRKDVIAVSGIVVGLATGIATLRSQSIPRLGYTITLASDKFDSKTGAMLSGRSRSYLQSAKSDGTTSRYLNEERIQETIDPNTRLVTNIDHQTRTFHSQPLSAQAVSNRKAPVSASCAATFRVDSCKDGPSILGFVTKVVEISPAGSPVHTRVWVSPQLGWAPLRSETYSNLDVLVDRTEATSVQVGEPADAVFQVPIGYAEQRDAAAHLSNGSAARGQSASAETLRNLKEMDAAKRANIVASYGIAGTIKLAWIRFVTAML